MARQTKKDAGYKEFKIEINGVTFSGRLYTANQRDAGKVTITPMSLQIDDLLTIKGCALKQTDNNAWIAFPEYKNKDNKYVSYVYVSKEQDAFNELCGHLEGLL